jgi:transcription antitermination factor NusG
MNTAIAMYDGGDFEVPQFKVGDEVTAVEGPFQGFDGTVIEIQQDLWLAVVSIPLYGREHMIPLRFHEIAKREG